MAYTANITQNITPSAPDPSGAISAIQSQADITKTIFGGIAQGFEAAKRQDLKALYEEGVSATEDVFKEHQRMVSEQKPALADYMQKSQQGADLKEYSSYEGNDPLLQTLQEKSKSFSAELSAAADRYKQVADAGGMSRRDMLQRVDSLVKKYGAMYPSSLPEIRQIVAKATGVEGADLWAENMFIKQLFTPTTKGEGADKSLEQAQKEDRDLIVKYLGISNEQALVSQRQGGEAYQSYLKQAQDFRRSELTTDAYKNVLTQNGLRDDQALQTFTRTSVLPFANAFSNLAIEEYKKQNIASFNVLEQLSKSGQPPTPQQEAAINGLLGGLVSAVERGFNDAATTLSSNVGPNVSFQARDNALKELDGEKKRMLEMLKNSDPMIRASMVKTLTDASSKSSDELVKALTVTMTIAEKFGSETTIRNALAMGQYEADGKTETGHWKKLRQEVPNLVPWIERYSRLLANTNVSGVGPLLDGNPVLNSIVDARESPSPTPRLQDKKDHLAATEFVAKEAVDLVKGSFQTSKVTQNQAYDIATALEADLNTVGTCLSNGCNGFALQLIDKNKTAISGWYSKIPEESKVPVQYAVSETGKVSLESARRGLGELNTKFKTNIKLGISPNTGKIEVVPPPADYFVPMSKAIGSPLAIEPSPLTRRVEGRTAAISGLPIPEVFKKYYPNMYIKPEYVTEVTKMADAAQEFNKTYLPRVNGAATSWGIVKGVKANDIAYSLMQDKPIEGFFKMETPVKETPAKETSFKSTPQELDRVSILTQELSGLGAQMETAKKRMERAKRDGDSADVSFYQDELKRLAADEEPLKRELARARQGR